MLSEGLTWLDLKAARKQKKKKNRQESTWSSCDEIPRNKLACVAKKVDTLKENTQSIDILIKFS